MKTIKFFVFFLFITCYCISCTKESRNSSRILIQNRTNNTIRVIMYSKSCYNTGECKSYYHSDVEQRSNKSGSVGGSVEWSEVKYVTRELDIIPHTIVSDKYDSIYIITPDNIIIFTHDKVTGYTENIFDENSTWDFKMEENHDKPANLWREPIMHYKHIFLILEEKIINNNNKEE